MNSTPGEEQLNTRLGSAPQNWHIEPMDRFVPTAVQMDRVQALKRFNLWVIYVPLGLVTAIVLGLFVYLLILAIWPPYEDTRLFLSGIADVLLILFMLPVALISALLLAGIFGGLIYWRQSRKDSEGSSLQKKYGRFRLLLWKVDQQLAKIQRQADETVPAVANPIIKINAFLAYLHAWLAQIVRQFRQNVAE